MDDDIVIICAKRTAYGKAGRGSFSKTPVEHMIRQLIEKSLKSASINPELIEDIVFGTVLTPGGGVVEARISALKAGIPKNIPVLTVNRQCASGLESLKIIADRIKNQEIEIGMAGGFEMMTKNSLLNNFDTSITQDDLSEDAKGCLLSMGLTSENLADCYNINRELVDEYAFKSHLKAYNSTRENLFSNEIMPVYNIEGELIDKDDGVRAPDFTKIKSLKPCFKENGVSTAANSSQLSDGCSIVVLAKRKTAKRHGFKILGRFVDCLSVGCTPSVMGIGPVPAIKSLLKRNHLSINDISLFEINEAFGSQIVYCKRELGIKGERLNVKGGSIALGHPVGSSGGRLVASLLNSLKLNELGVVSLCAATGMGIAALFVKE